MTLTCEAKGRIERVFGTFKRSNGAHRARFLNGARSTADLSLKIVAYNPRRALNLRHPRPIPTPCRPRYTKPIRPITVPNASAPPPPPIAPADTAPTSGVMGRFRLIRRAVRTAHNRCAA